MKDNQAFVNNKLHPIRRKTMSNIDKFITNNLVEELDNKAAEVVSGGNGYSFNAVLPDGTVTQPGDKVTITNPQNDYTYTIEDLG